MPVPKITDEKLIQMTRDIVRGFYHRKLEITTSSMTDDFMWIGANDFQWAEGLEAFQRITHMESIEPPVLLSNEEYHVLFRDKKFAAIYGRYEATASLEDGSVLYAHVRGTYLWRVIDDQWMLFHIHGSHAQDIPLGQVVPTPSAFNENSHFFEYMKSLDSAQNVGEKIPFRDRNSNYHFLAPSDILYIRAARQWSVVHTRTESFQVRGVLGLYERDLPNHFLRIHKSYLVNRNFVSSIRRYQVTLQNGTDLPIGKERYMDIKQALQHSW